MLGQLYSQMLCQLTILLQLVALQSYVESTSIEQTHNHIVRWINMFIFNSSSSFFFYSASLSSLLLLWDLGYWGVHLSLIPPTPSFYPSLHPSLWAPDPGHWGEGGFIELITHGSPVHLHPGHIARQQHTHTQRKRERGWRREREGEAVWRSERDNRRNKEEDSAPHLKAFMLSEVKVKWLLTPAVSLFSGRH